MSKHAILSIALVSAALLTACGESTTVKRVENAGSAKPDNAMSSADFAAKMAELNGQQISIANCVLMTNVNDQGKAACTLADASGQDVKDKDGLPVHMFFSVDGLDAESKGYFEKGCPENLCNSHISGTVTISPGTNYVEFSNVSIGRN